MPRVAPPLIADRICDVWFSARSVTVTISSRIIRSSQTRAHQRFLREPTSGGKNCLAARRRLYYPRIALTSNEPIPSFSLSASPSASAVPRVALLGSCLFAFQWLRLAPLRTFNSCSSSLVTRNDITPECICGTSIDWPSTCCR